MKTTLNQLFALGARHFLACLFFLVFTAPLFAQTSTITTKIQGIDYKIETSTDKGTYEIKITDGAKFDVMRTTNYFTLHAFKSMVVNEHINNLKARKIAARDLSPLVFNIDTILATENQKLSDSFLELISILYNTEDSGQKIAEITLMDKVTIYEPDTTTTEITAINDTTITNRIRKKIIKRTKKERAKREDRGRKLDVNSAQIVFEDGTIKNIIIEGTNPEKEKVIFSNIYSIGITTRSNVLNFGEISLHPELSHTGETINLSDVITYKRITDLRTNDFSPADVPLVLYPKQPQELFKAPSSKLFQLNMFSDFVGLNENNPNGLVQVEFTKRINLWTKRTDSNFRASGKGRFTHLLPSFEISKLEENNRSIELSQFKNGVQITNYLNPLQLYRYSYARISNEINIYDLQGPSVSVHLNAFGGIGITNVKDTVLVNAVETPYDENVNTLMYGANVKFLFNPESRWSYQLSSRFTKLKPLSDSFNFASVEKNEYKEEANNLMATWEFLLSWNAGADNQIFGRFRFNHELKYLNNNFTEFQIGYSVFLKTSQVNKK